MSKRPGQPGSRTSSSFFLGEPLRILDFDIENRPLSYLGQDFTTAEVTAIAWAWIEPAGSRGAGVGSRRTKSQVSGLTSRLLGRHDSLEILWDFWETYCQADMVTGHYIRRHDLPIVNGALMEAGLPLLPDRLTQDTKLDLVSRSGISASQESLAGMLGVPAPKVHMTQAEWREANRLTPAGIELTRRRVEADVRQHVALRAELLKHKMLGPPRVWRSVDAGRRGVV